jgi:hypothetical protein
MTDFKEIPETEWDQLPGSIVYAARMLNQMHKLDPDALSALLHYQVPINDKLADSDLDFICMGPSKNQTKCTLGALGLIQGCLDFPIQKYRLFRMMPDDHVFEDDCCVHCGVKKGEPGDDKCEERPEILRFGILQLG